MRKLAFFYAKGGGTINYRLKMYVLALLKGAIMFHLVQATPCPKQYNLIASFTYNDPNMCNSTGDGVTLPSGIRPYHNAVNSAHSKYEWNASLYECTNRTFNGITGLGVTRLGNGENPSFIEPFQVLPRIRLFDKLMPVNSIGVMPSPAPSKSPTLSPTALNGPTASPTTSVPSPPSCKSAEFWFSMENNTLPLGSYTIFNSGNIRVSYDKFTGISAVCPSRGFSVDGSDVNGAGFSMIDFQIAMGPGYSNAFLEKEGQGFQEIYQLTVIVADSTSATLCIGKPGPGGFDPVCTGPTSGYSAPPISGSADVSPGSTTFALYYAAAYDQCLTPSDLKALMDSSFIGKRIALPDTSNDKVVFTPRKSSFDALNCEIREVVLGEEEYELEGGPYFRMCCEVGLGSVFITCEPISDNGKCYYVEENEITRKCCYTGNDEYEGENNLPFTCSTL